VKCKFCGCTEEKPCLLGEDPLATYVAGYNSSLPAGCTPLLMPPGMVPCAWLIPNVCTNPECVDKAYAEAKRDLVHMR